MRLVSVALACVLTAIGSTPSDAHATGSTIERLRPMQSSGRRALDEGIRQSPTFRRLVDRIRDSDVIVYIDIRPNVSPNVGGVLTFIARSATDRYLRVVVNGRNSNAMLVALLGHELQHAVEVADDGTVNDGEALRRLYERIGIRTSRDTYDSRAAQLTGRTVRAELHRSTPDTRLARHTPDRDDLLLNGGSISAQ
jgi:hypothetical protein